MKVKRTTLPDVLVLEPRVFHDARGLIFESYRAETLAQAGILACFVQDTQTHSLRRTLRGLHYQLERPQAKLVRAVRGAIWDVAVDLRQGSPTFARWAAVELSAENLCQVYIPPGFAHGFCVLSDAADVVYKSSDYHDPADQHGVAWNDPTLAIPWPVTDPVLSDRDRGLGFLSAARRDLPSYGPADKAAGDQ